MPYAQALRSLNCKEEIESLYVVFSLVNERKENLMLGQNTSVGAGRWPRICAERR